MTDASENGHGLIVSTYSQREAWVMAIYASDLPFATRVTAGALASHLNFETGLLCPSMATLARETSQTHRAVQRHIARLRSSGRIFMEKAGRTYRYKLGRFPVAITGPTSPVNKLAKATGQSCLWSGKGDRPVANTRPASREDRRPASPPNLEIETLEKNLGPPASLLAIAPGLNGLHHWAFEGCVLRPPCTLVFVSRMRMEAALKAYGQKIADAGVELTWSGAP